MRDVVVLSKPGSKGALIAVRHKEYEDLVLCGGVRQYRIAPPDFPPAEIRECGNCARFTEGEDGHVHYRRNRV